MQIGNRVIQSYDTNIQNSQIEQIKTTQQSQSQTSVAQLKEGAVFKGEVLNIVGDKITISLEDQAQLLARLQEGVELGVGDRLLFSVKENTSNQVLIKPLFDSLYSAQTQVLERALDAANLSPTEKNFSVAKELMDAGMPVDKANLVKVLSQSMKFEGTSIQTLVSLNKMNIPVTPENIAQFERYQGYQHQLTNDISNVATDMASFTQAFPENTSGQTLVSVANQILSMIQGEQGQEGIQQQMPVQEGQEAGIILQNSDTVSADVSNANVTNTEQAITNTLSNTSQELTQVIQQEMINDNGSLIASDTVSETTMNQTGLTQEIAQQVGLSKEGMNNLSNALLATGVSNEEIQTMFQTSKSGEELLNQILQTLSTSNAGDSAIRSILDSNEFRNLFSETIKKNWSLQPKNMKDPKEIDELYDKILKQSRSFENIISTNGGEGKSMEQSFQNMRQNMQFMDQINQQMIYAQMPLKLTNQNANSELFVYADKRKLAQKKDGISVMLHLDMDNLGNTDVHVTLTGTNVNARFYLDDQVSVDIVTEHMNQLAKQLADRGFSLTNEVVKRTPQESINKVVDEIIDENAERSIKRYTFDARM
ncbi:MAG: flagellar hook-length control protein FliK [Lachnospiraceae bacterium]|nr:flagellar hook-length control protein FliK [Lachnospiraceae bacterium]